MDQGILVVRPRFDYEQLNVLIYSKQEFISEKRDELALRNLEKGKS